MNPIELGKFLAQLRNDMGLTQEELAEKLFIDKRKVSRWECGTSVPEFDILIKLSQIFNVSLYELSIYQKIDNKKINQDMINRFKSIKDYKKYRVKKIIKIIILVLLLILLSVTTIYTIKNSGAVQIYEIESLDKDYYIEGNYIKTNEYSTLNIKQIGKVNSNDLNNCSYEIYSNGERLFYLNNSNEKSLYHDKLTKHDINNKLDIKVLCHNKKEINYNFQVKLNKKYDNSIF